MQQARTFALLMALVVGTLSTSMASADSVAATAQVLPLRSVLRRDNDVFASNSAGLYRADVKSKTWKPLPLPATMPVGGYFANQPASSKVVFYYTPKWITARTPDAKTKVNGLYLSDDDGATWRLIAKNDDYGPVFLHPSGNVFAVTDKTRGPARIAMSRDLGATWREIPGKGFGMVFAVFADPDHPNLICVGGNGIRNYIYQAEDENYEWKATREWDWWPRHETEESFFNRDYATDTTLYLLNATLQNYFAHDFGKGAQLSAFDIVPQKSAYTFGKEQAKTIQVAIPFLQEPTMAALPGQSGPDDANKGRPSPPLKPSPAIKLVDQKEGHALWGLKVVGPDGKRISIRASAPTMLYESKDRAKTKQQLHETGSFEAQEVAYGKLYTRQIDLGQLYDFSKPGTYKVQLTYDNFGLGDLVPGAWIGLFTGQVFVVTIT